MKISVIGAGNVGASVASTLVLREVADEIALVDIFGNVAAAKAIDLAQSAAVFGIDVKVEGGDDFSLLKDSDIVVITAGSPRKEGQTREDLLLKNAGIVKSSVENIVKFAPNAIIITVTNPLDVLNFVVYKVSGFDKKRIIGMAGELDSARLKFEIGQKTGLKNSEFNAHIIGSHNDDMLVLKENVSVNLDEASFNEVAHEAKTGGAKIVKLLGTSAYYAPGAAVAKMCEAIVKERDEWLSCCVVLDENLTCGRRVRLGKDGIKEIKELSQNEKEAVQKSQDDIKRNIEFLIQSKFF
ncbi:malate dehydrogenase [Campylobacter sp. CCUG 57310]|uniref:malate dehydrogenase n=1 Tax=Campylobacter sp. CCUG 57310 TaxID=2517362 RepID=UPI001564C5B1|nr:malate dehydrogenase [Campylobacter sp. CCUG 57310]QKF92186.1 malate dehydrogenase, NAD-dependent [Campylobacter sp. CCUG 57310]